MHRLLRNSKKRIESINHLKHEVTYYMRKSSIFILVSLAFSFVQSASAQKFNDRQKPNTYRNADNPFYWKNKMPHPGYWQQDVYYNMDMTVDDKEESISGTQEITYWNNSPDTLTEIYFHLYQNAFQPNSIYHSLREAGKLYTVFGENELKGLGTRVEFVKVNGVATQPQYRGDKSVMRISLPNPLLPNSSVKLTTRFATYWDKEDGGNIRRRMKTFRHGKAYGQEVIHFDGVHWYPRICVYDRKFGWTTDPHLGKEFYGDYGAFDVKLNFPNQYIVEATGQLQNFDEVYPGDLRERIDIKNYKTSRSNYTQPVPADGSTKTWVFHAENVHDFAFTADPTYRIGETIWNGISCIALVQEEHAHRWQQSSKFLAKVIEVYSTDIGMYAYPKIIAADARDGMEYPMITLDGGNWPGHAGLIAHEVGHNWFFGMVGNNETYRASLDEGFTQFLTAWSLRKIKKDASVPNKTTDARVFYGYMSHATGPNNARLNIHSDHYNSAERHGGGYGQVYYKTATMLYNLEYVLGDELFLAAMQNYFNEWKMAHPYWEDFRNSIIRYTKVDLNWVFDQWLTTNDVIDYRISNVKKNKGNMYDIEIERKGMQMPLDITITGKDGRTYDFYIPNTYFIKDTKARVAPIWQGWGMVNQKYVLTVRVPEGMEDVKIDPSGRLADVYRLDNSKKMPKTIKFDDTYYRSSSFHNYQYFWRPDVWYSDLMGLRAGLHVNGNYFYNKHIFDVSVGYNLKHEDIASLPALYYDASYKTRIGTELDFHTSSWSMDGFDAHKLGFSKRASHSIYDVYLNSFNAGSFASTSDVSFNIDFKRNTKYYKSKIQWKVTGRVSANEDFNYQRVNVEFIHRRALGKAKMNTRVFAQGMTGSNPNTFAMLPLGGATYEEQMNHLLYRTGWMDREQENLQNTFTNTHLGGGLNLRAYSGYLATVGDTGNVQLANLGRSGASVNVELDFRDYIPLRINVLRQYFTVQTYLFADAGILGSAKNFNSELRADAGIGSTLAINFGRGSKIKPLVIRFDVPFFVNRLPHDQDEYVAFRYMIGINRAF